MSVISMKKLLEVGVHFGHQTKRWNPKMAPYIFTSRNGIYIIDLQKSSKKIDEAYKAMNEIAEKGGKVLFVGTKKQAQEAVKEEAIRSGSFYVNSRWLGGTLTNFKTIQKRIRRLIELEKMEKDGTFDLLPKKEVILLKKEAAKLEKNLGGIKEMRRLPSALFVVDPKAEHNAVAEARILGIPVFGIVDTNCDPDEVDYVIPANDDAIRAVKLIVAAMADAICEAKSEPLTVAYVKDEDEKEVIKEINQFIQILINHTSFTQKIDTHKLYKKENNSISFQMNYINDIASNYIHNLEETLLKLEEGSYQENNHSPYNKKLLKINQQKGIVARIPIGSLTNNIFLQDRGPSFSIKYKTLSLTSSNIDKKIKNYGINHLAISIDLNVTIVLQILVPLYHEHFKENYTIPLVYEVIEGEVPSWYQN